MDFHGLVIMQSTIEIILKQKYDIVCRNILNISFGIIRFEFHVLVEVQVEKTDGHVLVVGSDSSYSLLLQIFLLGNHLWSVRKIK